MKCKALISINIAVLLFGLAGLFAKWISIPAIGITFGRVFFSSLALLCYMVVTGRFHRVFRRRDIFLLICGGGILAIHWWAFLASIQLSTVAIGTVTFSAFPMFVTFLEPMFFRQPLKPINIGISAVILAGVCLMVPELSLGNQHSFGVLVGMLSALAYAVLTLMNKGFAERYSGTVISFYEQAAATVFLFPFVFVGEMRPTVAEIGLLLVLGILTTALAHTIFISSLRVLSARVASVCATMEPVYGILFAFLLIHEVPSTRECLGAVVILGTTVYAQWKALKAG